MAWAFILTPLLVLPIVLLYRFVGCGLDAVGTYVPSAPRYRDYIYPDNPSPNPGWVPHPQPKFFPKVSDVIGYWRLLDKPGAVVVHDETGTYHGEYHNVPGGLPQPGQQAPASETAPGEFSYPQEGLIVSDTVWCRLFNGAYAMIPFKAGLYTDAFTIAVWVKPLWGQNHKLNYRHTLFSVGGRYVLEMAQETWHGFSLLANEDGRWEVQWPGEIANASLKYEWPLVTLGATTYLAITVGDDGMRLYVNGINIKAVERQYPPYKVPRPAPLIIGVDNANVTLQPLNGVTPRYPVISEIQEVVLYRRALAPEEIENRFAINRT